jgi:hypothetical protein
MMKWTEEKPTKEGFYWAYVEGFWHELWILELEMNKGKLEIVENSGGYENEPEIEIQWVTHWMGPLEKPDLPV